MGALGKRGPERKYPAAVETQQAVLAQALVDAGKSWTEIIVAFSFNGWIMSQSLLERRFKEWGIRRNQGFHRESE